MAFFIEIPVEFDVAASSTPGEVPAGFVIDVAIEFDVAGSPPTNIKPPVIAGVAQVGQTLTVVSEWVNADTITYQWRRDIGAGPVAIIGAVQQTYPIVVADVGATITVVVTAQNEDGSSALTSGGVIPTLAPTGPPPDPTPMIPVIGLAARSGLYVPKHFGVGTQLAKSPGIRHQYRYRDLWINRRGIELDIAGAAPSFGENDSYRITSVTGFEDGDLVDTREGFSGTDGEQALNSLSRGRTIAIEGFMETGSIMRLEDMKQAFRTAFESPTDKPLLVHDPYQSIRDDSFSAMSIDYLFDMGNNTLGAINRQLVPTTTDVKQLFRVDRKYEDCQVYLKYTTGATLGVIEVTARRLDSNNFISARISSAGLNTYKYDGGVLVQLGGSSVAVSGWAPFTTYWILLRVEGNQLTAEHWGRDPVIYDDPIATKTHTLIGADATKFGRGILGNAGFRVTPASLQERYEDFSVDLGRDVFVSCRKSAMLPGVDQQADARYRRPFQVILRAPNKDMLGARKVVGKTMSGVAPVSANETFARASWDPFNAIDGSFSEDSFHWGYQESTLADKSLTKDGSLVLAPISSDPVVVFDSFSPGLSGIFVPISGRRLDGVPLEQGAGLWSESPSGSIVSEGFRFYGIQTPRSNGVVALGSGGVGSHLARAGTGAWASSSVECGIYSAVTPEQFPQWTEYTQGVFARFVDVNNYIRFTWGIPISGQPSQIQLIKRVNGVETTLYSINIPQNEIPNTPDEYDKIRLVVLSSGYWILFVNDSYEFSGVDAVLATGGALAQGGVGIFGYLVYPWAGALYFNDFSAKLIQPRHLNGMARYIDRFTSSSPLIGDATHRSSVQIQFLETGQSFPISDDQSATFYLILKSIRTAKKLLAVRIRGFSSGPLWRLAMSVVTRSAGASDVVIVPEVDVWTLSPTSGIELPFDLVVTVSGNTITSTWSLVNSLIVSNVVTLTGENASMFGAGVEGEVGFEIVQETHDFSRPRIQAIDSWSAIEFNNNPQIFPAYNRGSYQSKPLVRFNGPFPAGSYLYGLGPEGETIGPLVLAKSLLLNEQIIYDVSTGLTKDENGQLAGDRIAIDAEDIVVPGGASQFELIAGGWTAGVSRVELDYRDNWR